MRVNTAQPSAKIASRLVSIFVAAAVVVGLMAAPAQAKVNGTPIGKQTFYVNGCGMPNVKVRAWTKKGNRKTAIFLDGLRAGYGYSGWEINTNIQELVRRGVNIVEPIGGPGSFYADWNSKNSFNGQKYKYMWNCVVTKTLIKSLDAKGLRGPSGRYAILGLSMGGGPALVIAGQNPQTFDRAAAFSALLNPSSVGMQEAVRVMLLDANGGPWNSDNMWGAPYTARWYANDPTVNAAKLRGMKVYVACGNGKLGAYNKNDTPMSLVQGVPLEVFALRSTQNFVQKARAAGVNVMTKFPDTGTHTWGYWADFVWDAYNRGFFK